VPHPDAEFKVQQYVNNENNRKKLLHVETPHMAYFGYSGNKQLDCKYLVVEVEGDKAEVYDTDCFEMDALLPCNLPEHLQESDDDGVDERTEQQKMADLTRDFGSHKNKMMLKKKEKHDGADNTEALSKAAFAVAENINLEKLSMSMAHNEGAGEQTFLPCNRQADSLEEVYDVSRDLVPKAVLNSLGKKYHKLLTASKQYGQDNFAIDEEAVREEKFEDHVTKLMLGIPPNHDSADQDRVMSHVVFCKLISLMIKLHKLRASEARKMNCFEEESAEVRKWLFSEFFIGEGRTRAMPGRKKNKAIGYAIVLAWKCFNFRIDAGEMEAALSISPQLLSTVTRQLLGRVRTLKEREGARQSVRMCVLSLPLQQVPTVARGKK